MIMYIWRKECGEPPSRIEATKSPENLVDHVSTDVPRKLDLMLQRPGPNCSSISKS